MRWLLAGAIALTGCIEDRVSADEPEDVDDVGVLDARPKLDGAVDGAPPRDAAPRDSGRRDGGPRDAGRDSAPLPDGGPSGRCDQPDPGACEAAGCQWSDLAGCQQGRSCRLGQRDCEGSAACFWGPQPVSEVIGCWPAPGSTCGGWRPVDCEALEACVIIDRTCIDGIDAPCDQVAVGDCWRAPDCVSQLAEACTDQPKQQEPPPEADAGPPPEPDTSPDPLPEPEAPPPECSGSDDCDNGDWCRSERCISCDVPERCVDRP